MWREWLGLAFVFTLIFTLLNGISSTATIAQTSSGPTDSTDLTLPPNPSLQARLYDCSGNTTYGYANYKVYGGDQCAPLTSTTNSAVCGTPGETVVGVEWSANWTSTVWCRVYCQQPVATCDWKNSP